jgi:hypothetical protein
MIEEAIAHGLTTCIEHSLMTPGKAIEEAAKNLLEKLGVTMVGLRCSK